MDWSVLVSSIKPEVIAAFGVGLLLIAEAIKQFGKKKAVKLDKFWVSIVLFVMSLAVVVVYYPFDWSLPGPDGTPGGWQVWLQTRGLVMFAIMGIAMWVYNLAVGLWKRLGVDAVLDEPLDTIDLDLSEETANAKPDDDEPRYTTNDVPQ